MNRVIVQELERRFLPAFKKAAEQFQREFPLVSIDVWSSPTGSATPFQGHDLGIDCVFRTAPKNQPDNVALSIGVMHLDTNPMLYSAGVYWGAGAGDGCESFEMIINPVPLSEAMLDRIEAGIPTLCDALRAALCHPPFAL